MDPVTGKRLVIFGCGYVGSAVALEALARGVRVTALTRNAASATVLREQGIDVVVADLASDAWHLRIPGAADFVLNCVSSGGGGIAGYRRSYVDGMSSIVTWARRNGLADTFVYTSSTSVYPQGGGAVVAEAELRRERERESESESEGEGERGGARADASRRSRGGLRDPVALRVSAGTARDERAAVLLEAEDRLRAARAACRRWFVLRLAGIYGPGRHHLLEQVKSGECSDHSDRHLNLVHRDDIVSAVWACFLAPAAIANETFNVCDDGAARKGEIVNWIAAQIGAPVPRFTGEPAAGRAGTPDRIIANGKLKAMLGWRPKYLTFREGYEPIVRRG